MFARQTAALAFERVLPTNATKEDRTIVLLTLVGVAMLALGVAIVFAGDIEIYKLWARYYGGGYEEWWTSPTYKSPSYFRPENAQYFGVLQENFIPGYGW